MTDLKKLAEKLLFEMNDYWLFSSAPEGNKQECIEMIVAILERVQKETEERVRSEVNQTLEERIEWPSDEEVIAKSKAYVYTEARSAFLDCYDWLCDNVRIASNTSKEHVSAQIQWPSESESFEQCKSEWANYPSQDNEGYLPDRGGFKCGWKAAERWLRHTVKPTTTLGKG